MIRIFAVLGALLSAQLLGFDLLGSAAAADDREKLLGNWKLVSFFTEDVDSKQRNDVYGERPNG
jgi:hypothetical protein